MNVKNIRNHLAIEAIAKLSAHHLKEANKIEQNHMNSQCEFNPPSTADDHHFHVKTSIQLENLLAGRNIDTYLYFHAVRHVMENPNEYNIFWTYDADQGYVLQKKNEDQPITCFRNKIDAQRFANDYKIQFVERS